MKLSIVIPAYNEEKYLGTCLEFVLREIKRLHAGNGIEVIVVNNASADKTGQIARSFAGVCVVDEPKKGLSQARQTGFAACSGQFVANIDADTRLPKGWIKKVLAEIEKDENLVALSGPYTYYDLPMISSVFVSLWYRIGQLTHFLNQSVFKKGAMLQGGNFILRKSALDQIGGFDVSINFWGEDTDIARRISAVGRVKFTFSLPMPTSARRFKKEGFISVGLKYLINYIWILIFKKPFTKEYTALQ